MQKLHTGFQPAKRLKESFLRLNYREVSLDYRGLTCDPAIKPHLEIVPTRFLDGYHLALGSQTLDELVTRLDEEIESAFQGFAYEGAAMYLALMDFISPLKGRRVHEFLGGLGQTHDYIICIGIGFAIARIPWARRNAVGYALQYPPGYAALVLDGYGFHEGFFHSNQVIDRCERRSGLEGDPGRCFDVGLGRALWFVKGASPERLYDAIERFPLERRADLWVGLGLACAYAGSAYADMEAYTEALQRLKAYAGSYQHHLGLGVIFAAETRRKANNPTVWAERACETILHTSFAEGSQLGWETWCQLQAELRGRPHQEIAFQMYLQVCARIIEQLQAPDLRLL